MKKFPIRFAISALVLSCVLSGCSGCVDFGTAPKDGPRALDAPMLSRIRSVPLDAAGDTVTITLTYDANGRKVREVEYNPFHIVREYDSLGRYVRWTQHNHRDTVEVVDWITPDSSVRGAPGSSLKTAERWFGLRPGCRCADSVYRYAYNGELLHVRRYTYDSWGNVNLVTRDHFDPPRRDTAQRAEAATVLVIDGKRPASRLASDIWHDREREESTRRFFDYAPLKDLIEAR